MQLAEIVPPHREIIKHLQDKIDQKTKPFGALGVLEEMALQVGLIQQTLTPKLVKPHIIVFAADHGIAKEGVSAYPQEVTHQMVLNFLSGGAAINVFAKQHNIQLTVVDAGVNHDFGNIAGLIDSKIAPGTASFLEGRAMSRGQCEKAIEAGADRVESINREGTNIIGFGEMGIGNTASASLLMHVITKLPLEECVGRGTGIDDQAYSGKIRVLKHALNTNGLPEHPLEVLSIYGGFEIAMMCGAMLKAASLRMTLLVDGFIASAAFLMASQLNSNVKHYAIFCHQSEEKGHQKLLDFLNARPVLNLKMRLGEGTGCAVAYPILESALGFVKEMASFESAGVSEKN